MNFIDKSQIMQGIGPDSTADILEKAMGHKYFKREGTPGNYKYYYTEAEYKQAKGKGTEGKGSSETIEKDGKKYKLQPNGKYLEISEHGLTKEQHEAKKRKYLIDEDDARDAHIEAYSKRYPHADRLHKEHMEAMENRVLHQDMAKKLSDKEFTKEELKGDKKEDQKKEPEVIEKDDKKYKLQPNGKYLEVSEHGMTKKEHSDYEQKQMRTSKTLANKVISGEVEEVGTDVSLEEMNKRISELNKFNEAHYNLSSKEFTKEELASK